MKSMPICQHTISSVSENVCNAVNDHSFQKCFLWANTPNFYLRSLGPQAKSMKSMPICQRTISSVSENIYEVVNDHYSQKQILWGNTPNFFEVLLGPKQSQWSQCRYANILFNQSQKISMKLWTTTVPKKFFCKRTPPIFLKVSRAQSKVNEVNADMPTYYFISLIKCLCICEGPLFPKNFFCERTPPICLKVVWAPSKVNEVNADTPTY